MISSRRDIAILAQLEEIDLGEFRLTLSQPAQSTEMAEIRFHIFGQVAHQDLEQVTEALASQGPELRHRVLLSVRQFTLQDLEDAELTLLRKEITGIINEILPDKPLQSVGFYTFTYNNF